MGIQGLLPTLKSITGPCHVRYYAGKRAAVDTYSWLHKAAFSCSKDICLGRPNDKYIDYCMHRVNMLRHFGVQPVLVFDGGSLPMKSDQEIKRARSRKENLDRALEHERSGNTSAAYECFQRAVDITPAIAFRLIKVLRQENVEYVVAPYEADAQMAFLARNGHVDLVITEDSDLIAYGCPQILFKMDKYGQGVRFQYADIPSNKDLDFNNFSKQMILEMCIMSGCDYLSSLPGMGVKKAHGLIKRYKTYDKVIKHLKFSGVFIDKEYEQGFHRAILTFQHHRVYDPTKREMVHLTELPSGLDIELDFLGPYLPQAVATAVAIGEVDPTTYEPFEDICSSKTPSAAPKASVHRGPPIVEVEKSVLITKFFQGPGEPAKKLIRPRRNIPDIPSSHFSESQEEMASQVTPSPILSSQTYSSPFSRFAFTSQQSPVYTTPPSQESPFVREDLDLDEDSPRIVDLTSEYPPPVRPILRIPGLSDEKQRDEIQYPFPMDSPSSVKAKVSKTSVPLLQIAATQLTSAKQLRVQAICPGVKKSAYFSQSSPSPLPPTSPSVSPEVDAVEKAGDSSPQILSDTQTSEAADIDYESLLYDDVQMCADANKEILKDVTNDKTAATGKRKQAPHFQSDLLGKRPIKSRSFSSVSHVGQYAGLAQRSMDDFVSTLAPFRTSQSDSSRASGSQSAPSKQGTRASGLRAPSKSAQKASVSRALTKKISDFALTSRRLSLPESAAAGDSRWQVYNEADWEKA